MLLKYLLVLTLTLAGYTTLSAQLVVAEKPVAPSMRKQLKAPQDDSFFLVPAEWSVKDGNYYYVQPRYVKSRPGFKHVPGKWKKVKGGWTWRPAVWTEK